MSLGLNRAGFKIVSSFDKWQAALSVYRRNMPLSAQARAFRIPHHAQQADIADMLMLAPRIAAANPDMIAGGPPCQDFSGAGHQVEGTRADMTLAYAMIIAISRPRWFDDPRYWASVEADADLARLATD